jgi:argininosuccinate synthase
MPGKVVLAYSGGLDTSVAIKWIKEKYNLDVIALTVDVGNERDFSAVQQKARDAGAIKALVVDAKETFVKHFIFPALKADALYEGQYPLATALSRPLIGKLLADTAHAEGAEAVAHGCTGKGNDQVRIDVSVNAMAPELRIVASSAACWKIRGWNLLKMLLPGPNRRWKRRMCRGTSRLASSRASRSRLTGSGGMASV